MTQARYIFDQDRDFSQKAHTSAQCRRQTRATCPGCKIPEEGGPSLISHLYVQQSMQSVRRSLERHSLRKEESSLFDCFDAASAS